MKPQKSQSYLQVNKFKVHYFNMKINIKIMMSKMKFNLLMNKCIIFYNNSIKAIFKNIKIKILIFLIKLYQFTHKLYNKVIWLMIKNHL